MVTRKVITLVFISKEEIEKGVFENKEREFKVYTKEETIYQNRIDSAMANGFQINGRFKLRRNILKSNENEELKYIIFDSVKYRVNQIIKHDEHFASVEIGEVA